MITDAPMEDMRYRYSYAHSPYTRSCVTLIESRACHNQVIVADNRRTRHQNNGGRPRNNSSACAHTLTTNNTTMTSPRNGVLTSVRARSRGRPLFSSVVISGGSRWYRHATDNNIRRRLRHHIT